MTIYYLNRPNQAQHLILKFSEFRQRFSYGKISFKRTFFPSQSSLEKESFQQCITPKVCHFENVSQNFEMFDPS